MQIPPPPLIDGRTRRWAGSELCDVRVSVGLVDLLREDMAVYSQHEETSIRSLSSFGVAMVRLDTFLR